MLMLCTNLYSSERKQYSQQVMPPHLHGVRGHTVPASVNSRGGAGVVIAPMRSQTKYMGNAPPQPQVSVCGVDFC